MARRRRGSARGSGRRRGNPQPNLLLILLALAAALVFGLFRDGGSGPPTPPGETAAQTHFPSTTTPANLSLATIPEELPPPPRMTPTAAIGTFNIEWFGAGGRKPRTDDDIRSVAEVIRYMDPAILGLQEIGDEETMDRLIHHLPGYRYVLGTSGRLQRQAILWDESRATVGRPVEWPDINADLERAQGDLRAPLVAPARVGDFTFLLVVVHLKAMFDDRSIGMRRTQARRLRIRVDEWMAQTGDNDVVIAGDFNDLPDSSTLREFTAIRRDGRGFVNTGERLPDTAVTYMNPAGRIDHVVISSPSVSQTWWTGQAFVFPRPRGPARELYERSVSDHLPAWAMFHTLDPARR